MASTSSSSHTNKEMEEERPNPSTFLKRVLRNAVRIHELAHKVDASMSAPNTDLFPEFLKCAVLNLESVGLVFDTVMASVSVEEVVRLEPLRTANETALVGVRAVGDADKKARAAAVRAEKKTAKQDNLDADLLQTPQTLATATPSTYPPGTRLTKAGIPRKKSGPKPGSHRTPKEEKPKPTVAEIEQQKARGVGQPEALALLAEYFASSPVRQLSSVKRKASEEEKEVASPVVDDKKKSKAEMRAIKRMKKSRLSKGTPVEEEDQPTPSAPAPPPFKEEPAEPHTSPAKKQKKSKEERKEKRQKRKSDISMKDATPIPSPTSTPPPPPTSKSEKGRFADKFHPYKKPEKHIKRNPSKDDPPLAVTDMVSGGQRTNEPHETEDITAEVNEKMRRHHIRLEKEARAKELGINPSEKHKRESLGTTGPSPKQSRESIQNGTSSTKKRKTKKGSEERDDGKVNGIIGGIERKRKSTSPDRERNGGEEVVVEMNGTRAEEKKRRKDAKKVRRLERVDGMGDVVMGVPTRNANAEFVRKENSRPCQHRALTKLALAAALAISGLPLTLLPAPGAALGKLLPITVEVPMPEPAVTVRCAAVRGPTIPFCPALNVE
ncbi:hypothetical protein E6O75_ATG06337 [Venturia nashicola]|uniref:Uncharacterized protein n=1 Tax=Venturia nashicola TaxID=86259 RepID=A0A4Z1NRE7_9PEZI|nr:hypothetical protein E6O75_ATG06337 [Venturia nashicola]